MDMEKKFLKIAGILKCIVGICLLMIPFYGILMLACGIFLYIESKEKEEKIYQNRVLIFLVGILSVIELVGSILVFIVYDRLTAYIKNANGINAPPKTINNSSKESKKIDILLKLGVGMIFVSGILFLTTSWMNVSNYVKSFALVIFGILFLILSLVTESKFKLYKSSYTYWLLSMAFFVFTIISILYFGIFGFYLTYNGSGSNLVYVITFVTISGFSLITYLKYPKIILLFFSYVSLFASIYYLFVFLKMTPLMVLSLLSLVTVIINIVSQKNGKLFSFSKVLSYILFAFIVTSRGVNDVTLLIASLINIINLNYLTFIDKKHEESLINITLTYILIYLGLYSFAMVGNLNNVLIALITGLYTLLINSYFIPTAEKHLSVNYIIYSLINVASLYLAYSDINATFNYAPIIITVSYILVNIIAKSGLFNTAKILYASYLEPVSYMAFMIAASGLIFNQAGYTYALAITTLLYCLLHCFTNKEVNKIIYFISIVTGLIITFITLSDSLNIISSLIAIVAGMYIFTISLLNDDKKNRLEYLGISTILLFTCIYIPFVYENLLQLNPIMAALIFVIFMLVIVAVLGEKVVTRIACLYVIFPLLTVIGSTDFSIVGDSIINSIILLYMTYILIKFYVKSNFFKNFLGIIGLLLFTGTVFVENSVYAGVYVGIIGVIVIILGFKDDYLSPLFITGILYTIANIIYRCVFLWEETPFWLYLLIVGLILITFVTYKEINKSKK